MPNWAKIMTVLGASLVSISAMGAGYETWVELAKPAFFFGALGSIGTAIGALYANSPSKLD